MSLLEQAIIGYFLLYPDEIIKYRNIIKGEYFNNPNTGTFWDCLLWIFDKYGEVSLSILDSALKGKDWYQRLGGVTFLIETTDAYNSTEKIDKLIDNLINLYNKKKLERLGIDISKINSDISKEELELLADDTIEKILEIFKDEDREKTPTVEEYKDFFKNSLDKNKNKNILGYSWGEELSFFDKNTSGLRKGKTYRIAGLSGVGKTSFIYQIILNLLNQGAKILFLSLENSLDFTLTKLIATYQGVNNKDLENGVIEPNLEFFDKYKGQLIITDNIFDWNKLKREILLQKPDVVILDYLGLVEFPKIKEEDKYTIYADEQKKFIQKHQDICWIDLSNLNKSDTEETIRLYGGFNGSAKLRNNCDFGLHLFPHKHFSRIKTALLSGASEKKEEYLGKKVVTFLITKNRLGDDGLERTYLIDFNKGTKFIETIKEQQDLWAEYYKLLFD